MSGELYIGGTWRSGGGEAFESLNPATQLSIWQGNAANTQDVDSAINAARAAFPAWSALPLDKRIAYVERFKNLLAERVDIFATYIAEDTGKMLWDARGEVQAMIGKAAISAEAYNARTGNHNKPQAGIILGLRHRPHGVVAVFGPYNFPGHLPNGHIMPALIAGNTVVFKPSEQTPLVAEEMVKLWHELGLPAGVINLVQGARETGISLAAHEGIDGLFFTGSAEVGAALHRQFAGRPDKMLALEMGGNNPLVFEGAANIEAASLIALQSAFLSTGQRCTCARRLIVPHGKNGDTFIDAVIALAGRIIVSSYKDTPAGYMGPLISNREAERLLMAQDGLIAGGASALLPMKRITKGLPFVTAGILDVTNAVREDKEYFGPLLQITRVRDFSEAMREANNTRFGLSAGLISDSAEVYAQFIGGIRAGIVSWNRPTNGASSAAPFGGIGVSGNHRPSAYYAADYCAYPVASMESAELVLPETPQVGIRP